MFIQKIIKKLIITIPNCIFKSMTNGIYYLKYLMNQNYNEYRNTQLLFRSVHTYMIN